MLIVSVKSQVGEPLDMNINQGKSISSVLGDDMEGTHCDIHIMLITKTVVKGSENNKQRQKHRSS